LVDLEVLAVPVDRPLLVDHLQLPLAADADVHRHRVERVLGLAAAVPVGKPLGLGPLLPDLLAGRVEGPLDLEAGGLGLRHSWPPFRWRVAGPGGRTPPPRSSGSPRSSRPPPSAASRRSATAAAAPSAPG